MYAPWYHVPLSVRNPHQQTAQLLRHLYRRRGRITTAEMLSCVHHGNYAVAHNLHKQWLTTYNYRTIITYEGKILDNKKILLIHVIIFYSYWYTNIKIACYCCINCPAWCIKCYHQTVIYQDCFYQSNSWKSIQPLAVIVNKSFDNSRTITYSDKNVTYITIIWPNSLCCFLRSLSSNLYTSRKSFHSVFWLPNGLLHSTRTRSDESQ